jgi:hypothetical protein
MISRQNVPPSLVLTLKLPPSLLVPSTFSALTRYRNVVNGGRFRSSNHGEITKELIVTQSDIERLSTIKLLMISESSVNHENVTEPDDILVALKLYGELGTTKKRRFLTIDIATSSSPYYINIGRF